MSKNGPPHVSGPSLPYLVHRIARLLDHRINAIARRDGLKIESIRTLLRLWANDHQRVGDLAEATSIEQSALSHMLKRLESDGLVARKKVVDDSRSTIISLTNEGRRIARKYGPLFRKFEEASLAAIPASDRVFFKQMLLDVYERLRSERQEAALPAPTRKVRCK